MSNFWRLVKINLSSLFTGSFHVESKSNKRRIALVATLAFAVLYMAIAFGFIAYQIGDALNDVGMEKILIVLAFLASSAMIFIQVFFSSFHLLFQAKDYEQLACLPIRQSTIILSKILSYLIYCYSLAAVFFAPIAVIYFVFAPITASAIIYTILGFLFLPLFPLFLGLVISFLINSVTVRFPKKNLFNLILFFVFFVDIMILSQNSSGLITSVIDHSQASFDLLSNLYFPNIFVCNAIVYGDFVAFLIYIALSVIPLGLVLSVISKYYKKFYSFFAQSAKHKTIAYRSEENSTVKAMVKKEIKRIFSSPMIFFNSCIGPIMFIIFAILSLSGATTQISAFGAGFSFLLIMVPLSNLMMSSTSTTFSLEGNRFWLLKSLPLKLSDIIKGKIYAMLLIFAIPDAIGLILAGIFMHLSVWEWLVALVLMVASMVLSAVIGIVVNLHSYQLNWKNEITVVKQSTSVLICLGIGFAVSLIPSSLIVGFCPDAILQLMLGFVLALLYSLGIILLIRYLKKSGQRLFDRMK